MRLERDAEARDRYGRLLAYVYRADDGLFVNLALVEAGYADALTYRPNVAHTRDCGHVAEARGGSRGLWRRARAGRRGGIGPHRAVPFGP